MKTTVKKVIQGLVLGAAAIAPGLSGSALAVVFGIYDDLIRIAAAPFKNFWANVRYLLPLGIGAVFGFGLFALVIANLFENEGTALLVIYLFFGLLVGSLPSLFKEANAQGFKKYYGVILVVFMVIFGVFGWWSATNEVQVMVLQLNWVTIFLCGMLIGVGTVIPGLSSSFILIFLGVYGPLMIAAKNFDVVTVGLLGAGAVTAIVLTAKGIEWLLKKFYGVTYYVFMGIALGSMLLAFPGLPRSWESWLGAMLLFGGGIIGAWCLNKINVKKR